MRFAGVPETQLSDHLYLNWDKEDTVPVKDPRLIGKHRNMGLDQLAHINDNQPFSVYGTSREEDDLSGDAAPLIKAVTETAAAPGNRGSATNGHSKPVDQPVAGD
jgi:hypothetical protein